MDDLSNTLSNFLKDPESMGKIQQMANSLFAENGEKNDSNATSPTTPNILGDGIDISALSKIVGLLNTKGSDHRAGLLLALKPHLSDERAVRVDKAVKILKLVSLVPLLKDEGLLNF